MFILYDKLNQAQTIPSHILTTAFAGMPCNRYVATFRNGTTETLAQYWGAGREKAACEWLAWANGGCAS